MSDRPTGHASQLVCCKCGAEWHDRGAGYGAGTKCGSAWGKEPPYVCDGIIVDIGSPRTFPWYLFDPVSQLTRPEGMPAATPECIASVRALTTRRGEVV